MPSLSVSVGLEDKVVFAKAIGFSDVESRRKANQKSQYSVGSLAKPMTGIALAKLVDAGKIELEASVNTYLKSPELIIDNYY